MGVFLIVIGQFKTIAVGPENRSIAPRKRGVR
jgi:hypothetical protein